MGYGYTIFGIRSRVMQLSAGENFMQVSEWLGHANYVVTMTVYAGWMPAEASRNSLPAPPVIRRQLPALQNAKNVVPLLGRVAT